MRMTRLLDTKLEGPKPRTSIQPGQAGQKFGCLNPELSV